MAICIIPAKGTSTRIPGKNSKDFLGKPIIQYAIETAHDSGLFRQIIVSTDDEDIKTIARRYGAGVVHRDPEYADDGRWQDCGTQEVVRQTLLSMAQVNLASVSPDEIVVCLYPTAVLATVQDLFYAWAAVRDGFTWSQTVKRSVLGEVTWVKNSNEMPLPVEPTPKDAGAVYAGRAAAFMCRIPLEHNRQLVFVPEERFCDINTPKDWAVAEEKWKALHSPR